jgi:hypothetical protein
MVILSIKQQLVEPASHGVPMIESGKQYILIGAAALIVLMMQTAAGRDVPSEVIAESTVRAHMEFLASDAMNGRGSGSRDEWITATYIAAQMRRDGLEPLGDAGDFVQTVDITRTEVVGDPVFRIGDVSLRRDQLFLFKLNTAEAQVCCKDMRRVSQFAAAP